MPRPPGDDEPEPALGALEVVGEVPGRLDAVVGVALGVGRLHDAVRQHDLPHLQRLEHRPRHVAPLVNRTVEPDAIPGGARAARGWDLGRGPSACGIRGSR